MGVEIFALYGHSRSITAKNLQVSLPLTFQINLSIYPGRMVNPQEFKSCHFLEPERFSDKRYKSFQAFRDVRITYLFI